MIRLILQVGILVIISYKNLFFQSSNEDILILYLLLAFSLSILINIAKFDSKFKIVFLGIISILSFTFSKFSYLLALFVPSGYKNFGKFSIVIPIILLSQQHFLEFILSIIFLFLDYYILNLEEKLGEDKEEKLNLKERINSLEKSVEKINLRAIKDEQVAIQEERNRISRELHDITGHTLSASILNLKALSVMTEDKVLKEGILSLKGNLERGLEDMRSAMHNLRDTSFDLQNKIMELLEFMENVSFTYSIQSELNYSEKYYIYSIVREGVTNYLKHSTGKNFKVYLVENENNIILKIQDDGFVDKENFSEGMGINTIRQKVKERKWNLNIITENGFIINILMEKNK